MKPSSLKWLNSSNRKVRSRFLLPLACCLFSVAFCVPPRFQSPAVAQTINDRQAEADRLIIQGNQQQQIGQYQLAIQSHERALTIYRAIQDRNGEAGALANLGNAYFSLSRYRKAIEFYEQALPLFRQLGSYFGEAVTLNSLGITYAALSQYDKAIESLQQSLSISRRIGDRNGEAVALGNLGESYRLASEVDKAIEALHQALLLSRQVGNPYGEAAALGNLGNAYTALSQYGKALEYYQQSLSKARQIDDRSGEALMLLNIGEVYRSLVQNSKALESYQQALIILHQIGDRDGEAKVLNNLGLVYFSSSQVSKAVDYYQQSFSIFHQVGNRAGEARVLNNLGSAYDSLAQFGAAITFYQQALSISRQVGDRNTEANALQNLGISYTALKQYSAALKVYQQSLTISQQIGDRSDEGKVLNNLGFTLLKMGNTAAAEKSLFAAIAVWESLRPGLTDENKVSLFEEQARTYRTLQQTLIAQSKSEAALAIAERGRARAFVELLAARSSNQKAGGKEQKNSALNIQQIQQTAKAQNATLVQYSIIYDAFQIQGKELWQEAVLYVWVIQPTGKIIFRTVDLKPLWQQHHASLADLIIGNQEFLAVRSRSTGVVVKPQPNLPTLYQLLIDPIANLLPKDPNAHVIFIPQGPLFQVPFPALQDTNGTYLIQKHTILTAPSIQVLALTHQQRQNSLNQRGNALVLGNPTMPSASSPEEPKQSLPPLPGAEAEAKAIASLLNTQALIGNQGTKAVIKQRMAQASMIHLATHGLLDNTRGLNSAIALAPSGNDDGWLTADEILDMKLQANLVVLNACNTAAGKITGDGVIGLSRSLISAGVPSVIVSLWAIPDAPTAELMQTFYQNLQKNPDKAQALRQAMLTTLKTHPEPRDWAAFTLIGEAN
jgi:CHAT domain-containing protein/uncharacterized protein HemY